jgi:dTDP-4-amino-4,6-dideoxygalactose transaminase
LAEQTRLLREYGWAERYVSHISGSNSRLDELQAAVLRVKLHYLEADNAARANLASLYDAGLAGMGLVTPRRREDSTHVYHLYVIRSSQRNKLQSFLKANQVGALIHYPVPVHLQPAYHNRLPGSDSLPVTEQAAQEVLSLPIYPELTDGELNTVIELIKVFEQA